jgi:uncharacterized protein
MYLTKRIKIMSANTGHYFACNALTGEILLLTETGLNTLMSLWASSEVLIDNNFRKVLEEKHFLFKSEQDEEQVFNQICQDSWIEFNNNFPTHYTFIVNTQCNFNCPYCFETESARSIFKTLSEHQIASAFELIDQKSEKKPYHETTVIEIFGGEPLLPVSKTAIELILKNIASRNLTCSIQTNGYYLADYLSLISKYSPFINLIQITLDGPPHIHNQRRIPKSGEPTFDRLIAGIDKFLQMNLPIQLNLRTNVDSHNVDFLEQLIEFYEKKGWVHNSRIGFIAAPVDNRCGNLTKPSDLISWGKMFERIFPISKDNGRLFDLSVFKALTYFRSYFSSISNGSPTPNRFIPKVVYCEAAALKLFVFHPDGQIYPCPESVSRLELAIGRYFPDFQLYPEKALLWQNQTILKRQRCPSCEVSTFCGGGCILTALLQNGSMQKPICEETPEIISSYFNKVVSSV